MGKLIPKYQTGNKTPERKWLDKDQELSRNQKVIQAHQNEPGFSERMKDDAWGSVNTIGSFTPMWSVFAANEAGRQIDKGEYGRAAIEGAMIALPYGLGKVAKGVTNVAGSLIKKVRFQPQEGMMYRGIGEAGMKDALESGVFRAKPGGASTSHTSSSGVKFNLGKKFDTAYYAPAEKFDVVKNYAKGYIAEVPRSSAEFSFRYSSKNPWSQHTTTQIPIEQGRILKKDWLRGYKEIPKNPLNNISSLEISKISEREKQWLQSPEYLKRRMAATGETIEEINKDVGNILEKFNKTSINFPKKSESMAQGVYENRTPSINIFNSNTTSKAGNLATLDHEIGHAMSQVATKDNYSKYPREKFGNFFQRNGLIPEPLNKYGWINNPREQQVTTQRILKFIEDTQGIPRGTKLDISDVDKFAENINSSGKHNDVFRKESYQDANHYLNALGDKYKGDTRPKLLENLNKSYGVIPLGIIGVNALKEKGTK